MERDPGTMRVGQVKQFGDPEKWKKGKATQEIWVFLTRSFLTNGTPCSSLRGSLLDISLTRSRLTIALIVRESTKPVPLPLPGALTMVDLLSLLTS